METGGYDMKNIKLIAVDMDGTFLNDKMEYDRELFSRLYTIMKERGIHFVVASGNQYYQLKSFFGAIQDELTYVSENGALLVNQGEILSHGDITKEQVKKVISVVETYPTIKMVVCGVESAYILDTVEDEFYQQMSKYYHRLKKVDSYDIIDDTIIKFALTTKENESEKYEPLLKTALADVVVPTTSGHRSIDLIIPGLHKASGIEKLANLWNITPEQCIAFGDGGNDIEMLQYCKYGYAMENASAAVKSVCSYHTTSNNDNGVLKVLSKLLLEN